MKTKYLFRNIFFILIFDFTMTISSFAHCISTSTGYVDVNTTEKNGTTYVKLEDLEALNDLSIYIYDSPDIASISSEDQSV